MPLKPAISSAFVSLADDDDISPKIVINIPPDYSKEIKIYIHVIPIMKRGEKYQISVSSISNGPLPYIIDISDDQLLSLNEDFLSIDIAAISTIKTIPDDRTISYDISLIENDVVVDTTTTFIYFSQHKEGKNG